MHNIHDRQVKFEEIICAINISHCSLSCLNHIMETYGENLFTSVGIKEQLVNVIHSKIPKWQKPVSCVGCDIIILSGMTDEGLNRKSWKLNLKTGSVEAKMAS